MNYISNSINSANILCTPSDVKLLIDDFYRFANLHSWYKHLPIEPVQFIFFKSVGQQPRNNIHPYYTDDNMFNMHWHWYNLSECSENFLKKVLSSK